MSSNPLRLQYLFQQYLNDSGTTEELDEFWKLLSELDEEDDPIKNDLWQLWYSSNTESQSEKKDWGEMLQKIQVRAHNWEKNQSPVFWTIPFRRVAAAIVILILGIGAYFLLPSKNIRQLSKKESGGHFYKNDVSPGGNKAVLTLSDGTEISLGSAANGKLAREGNTNIIKLNNGKLSYDTFSRSSSDDKNVEVQYNTLTTPRGGQYNVVLPDGTGVWLNAASSLHYPTAFSGKERKVEITGEAYFEVAHDADKPFKVLVKGAQIEVLGTHFNVNAYNDEPVMKTTLLEGKIKFTSGTGSRLLSPGQQIQLQPNGEIKQVKDADIEQVIAWKNGTFSFDNTSIYEIMRQISRWYNVDVNFNDSLNVHLNGSIERKVNVSEVFKMIELTGEVEFNIEGRRITVFKHSK
ncbi:MAG TPA: FecR domain-containing protein [Hanamia sp.]|nr:FecR domain-containing protein [Hanamia sp.]